MGISLDAFLNITNIAFTYFEDLSPYFCGKYKLGNKKILQALFNKIVRLLNIKIDFENRKSTFLGAEDDLVITSRQAHKSSNVFKETPVDISSEDIEYIEKLLRDNDEIASYFYPLFSCLGYSLISDEGRWKLTKAKSKIDPALLLKYYELTLDTQN